MRSVSIAGRKIGPTQPTFIVAEAGVNHNGALERALAHIKQAKEAGADAIKFQTYTPELLVTKKAPRYWRVGDTSIKTQREAFTKFDPLTVGDYKKMMAYAKKVGIILFSSPFELEAVDLLEQVNVPAYKLAAETITYFPLLKKVAETKKPIILSVGGATIGEAEEAINYIKSFGNDKIILLHCILSYPTEQKDINLRMIDDMQRIFPDMPIGLSDHTFSPLTPSFAVMRGAVTIEKHFTIDKTLPDNPDHELGVDPKGMRQLVDAVRLAEVSLGTEHKQPLPSEQAARSAARRSITARVGIPKGTKITAAMLIGKRPGTGIPTKFIDLIIGRTARKDIPEDTTLTWDLL
jgi:N-acetylneuraminate synthase/N,N'-diacetyllegionaminate synthase